MGRSPYGWTRSDSYLGFPNAAAHHDHHRKADREDAYREELERADAARAKDRQRAE